MKKSILILLALFYYTATYSQSNALTVKSTLGPRVEEKTRLTSVFLGDDASGNLYFMRASTINNVKRLYFIDKMDKNLKIVQSKQQVYDQHSANKLAFFFDVFRNTKTGKSYFIGVNESGPKAVISALEIKIPEMTLATTGKVLDNTDKTGGQHWINHNLYTSFDSTMFAYTTSTSDDAFDGRQGSGRKYHVSVFDEGQQVKWSKDVELPIQKGQGTIQKICITNDGTLNFLVLTSPDKKLENSGSIYNDYSKLKWQLMQVKNGNLKTIDLKLSNGYISAPLMQDGKNGIVITGFYSSGNGKDILGVFSISIDAEGKVSQSTKPLPAGYILQKLKTASMSRGTETWNLQMGDMVVFKDGSVAWTAEQDFIDVEYKKQHDLGSIVIFINADNSIGTIFQYPKYQFYFREFMSAPTQSFIYNNKLYLLYLDNPANGNNKNVAEVKVWNQVKNEPGRIMLACINADGSFTTSEVLAAAEDNKWINLAIVSNVNSGNFLVWWEAAWMHYWSQPLKISITE